jgi:UDPglucose 6-dehydrogenase
MDYSMIPRTEPSHNKNEKVVIVGFGWVGQANGLALKGAGYDVYYFDVAEPQLRYIDAHKERYSQIKRLKHILENDSPSTWYIVCVGDRVSAEGEQDISAIEKALESLKSVKERVILRSTVLPGYLSRLSFQYYVPEFLHEKKAVEECMIPHYFIVGKKEDAIEKEKPSFFIMWERSGGKSFVGTPEEASYIKYLSNAWNALRIAFVNEFGNAMNLPINNEKLSNNEKVIDFFFERKAYLRYGKSFGGHCLPKDTRAFHNWHKKQGRDISLFDGMIKSNDAHRAIEIKHPHLPEWFSEWVRPQLSGWIAVKALRESIIRKTKKIFTAKKHNKKQKEEQKKS